MSSYNNACTEVSVILNHLNKDEYKKIPLELTEAIEQNKNNEVDEYQAHKDNPKSEISISGYHEVAEINEHESYSWVTLGISGDDWYAEDTLTPEEIKASIGELAPARDILPELWSQKLADLIWNSSLAMASYDAIPKQYVRKEWENLIEIYIDITEEEVTDVMKELISEQE